MSACLDCGKPLSSRNICGRCRSCVGKHSGAQRRIHSDKWCRVCGVKVSRFGKNSLCREHFNIVKLTTPEVAERRTAAIRRYAAENRGKMRQTLRENQRHAYETKPEYREYLRRRAKEIQPLGVKAGQTPEAIAKRGRAVTERRLGWCPLEWRPAHQRMIKAQGIPTAEAKRIILRQIAAEKRKTAEPKPPRSFEEKLKAVAEGRATIIELRPVRRELEFTLAGVSSGWDS